MGGFRYPISGFEEREVNMNVLPLVTQLRFARSEFVRSMDGVSDEDAQRHVDSLNCLSWMVGHLANQENRYWVEMGQRRSLFPELNELVGFRKPQSTPSPLEMWSRWKAVTEASDVFLNTLQAEMLTTHLELRGKPAPESIGTLLMRNTFHYWFHTGQAVIVRKMLGHTKLPEFVGDLSSVAY